jgi:hypothetical protein
LAQSLHQLPIENLQSIRIAFDDFPCIWSPGLLNIDKSPQFLSQSLRQLSQAPHLRKLVIEGCTVSPNLFWPDEPSALNVPKWHKLEQFHVEIRSLTPAGAFFDEQASLLEHFSEVLQPIPGFEDNHEYDLDWRTILSKWSKSKDLQNEGRRFLRSNFIIEEFPKTICNSKLLETYIERMSEARKNMPKIKNLKFMIWNFPPASVAYGQYFPNGRMGWRLLISQKWSWRPSLRLMNTLKASVGENGDVSFKAEHYEFC